MSDNEFTYRLATINDIELLARTRVIFFAEGNTEINDSQKAALYENNKAYFKDAIKDGSFVAYLAYDGDTLAATSGINFYMTPPSPKNLIGKTAYISNIYTKPDYRGKGIATRLFEMTLAEAKKRGCGKATLIASDMGRSIYEKQGFFNANGVMDLFIDIHYS